MTSLSPEVPADFRMKLRDVSSDAPFTHRLDYNPPARGVWNIVHMGLQVPESHVVFFCSVSCMRGVVLTAAEAGALERFSALYLTENDLLAGDGERVVIEGVTELLQKLPKRPRAVLLYTNCLDSFMGLDHGVIYGALRAAFPEIGFMECFMCPTLRKGALPPDPTMRKQLFSLLPAGAPRRKAVNFIGSNRPLPEQNELMEMLRAGGWDVLHLSECKTYDDYLRMAQSAYTILTNPLGEMAVSELESRLGQPALRIPVSYEYAEIEQNLHLAAKTLTLPLPDFAVLRERAEEALARAKKAVGDIPVAVDYMATSRPFGLAKLLRAHGFRVTRVYADFCAEADRPALEWLRENAGEIEWFFPYHHGMAVRPRGNEGPFLAVGQDAAYFTGTNHFVNIVESDGIYGFHGVGRLAALLEDAMAHEKDARRLIQIKGLGCRCEA